MTAESAPHRLDPAAPCSEHLVHVYRSSAVLARSVAAFLLPGLLTGEPALVVATPGHRARFAAELAGIGLDVPALRRAGSLVELDAEEVLASLVHDGVVDPRRFAEVVGVRVGALAAGHRRIHVYGEMVAVLWAAGHAPAALAVEHLWNDLARTLPFRLCCAYSMSTLGAVGDEDDVEAMFASHTDVAHA